MNICSIWAFAQISDDFYYLDIWQCARYFVATLFKDLALITIREMWGLESRTFGSPSRPLWQSLVSKVQPGLGLGGYSLDNITGYKWTKPDSLQFKCKNDHSRAIPLAAKHTLFLFWLKVHNIRCYFYGLGHKMTGWFC